MNKKNKAKPSFGSTQAHGSALNKIMQSPLCVISGGLHIKGGGGVLRDIYKVTITGPKNLILPLLEISRKPNDKLTGQQKPEEGRAL